MAIDQRSRAVPETDAMPATAAAAGTAGNERLTAVAGAVLLVLLAVIGVTLLQLRGLLWVHLFVGMLLIGPVALKLAGVGYRFVRYYTGDASYRRKGPPPAFLRALAPVLVVTTLVIFVSGVALLLEGPSSRKSLLPIHKISFIVWAGFFAVHVLAHLPRVAVALRSDYGRAEPNVQRVPGRDGRGLALASAIVAGLVLALVTIPDFGAWLNR
jgi:thiosulfate reductase cytochrome b subunit